jgi:DNA segregation ATPase FtsK/SpoIIIE-like protein
MARVRRKPSVTTRWNYEIAGIIALGIALLLAVSLIVPPAHTGFLGAHTATALHALFGMAAGGFPLLLALLATIVFLEINVPRMIASLGGATCGYFLIVDTALGSNGGMLGHALDAGLRALLGDIGVVIVLIVAALGVTVWITNVSVKKVIGWAIASAAALRPAPSERRARGDQSAEERAPGPKSLREAFHLPAILPRMAASTAVATVAAPAASVAVAVVTPPAKGARRIFDVNTDDETIENEEDTVDDAEDLELIDADDVELADEDDDDEYEDDEFDEDEDDDELDEDDDAPIGEELVERVVPPIVPATMPAAPIALTQLAPLNGSGADDDDDGTPRKRKYVLPDLSLFDPVQAQKMDDSSRSVLLEDTLASFGVGAKVTHIERGPSITRYELKPERGVKIARISALADDLALALAATSVRIEAPIPGKSAVGIEIPNATVSVVNVREILEAMPRHGTIPPLNMALGKDITGRPIYGDLGKMPHLLVAGATGSGKSVCLNCIIASLLVSATPDQVQMVMIDPKRVELSVYNGIPHLKNPVITDPRMAAGALFEMTKEMDQRYERFAKAGVRKIEEWNAKFPADQLPYIVIIIDELADLMLVAPGKVETLICRLAQLARATGIHLIVATQRPSVDVITGIIKANIPSRIAFAVSSQVDSRTILDMGGAERLLGRGDMLYLPIDAPKPVRSQGALITGEEVNRLVEFWAAQARPENLVEMDVTPIDDDDGKDRKAMDPLCYDAAQFIIDTKYASTAQLQSQFSIGHPRAVRLMKQLEDSKVVGPHEGTKPRRILIGLAELEQIAGRLGKNDQQQDLFA